MADKMNEEILIRLDEKANNMWRVLQSADDSIAKKLDKIIAHQETQNGIINENYLRSCKNSYRLKIMMGMGGTITVVVLGWLLSLTL